MTADSPFRLVAGVAMAAAMTLSVASSAYISRHDAAALTFLLLCYVEWLSLFLCAKWLEKLEPDGSPATRSRLRTAVWALASALTLSFACRVGLDMPWPLAVVVWSLSAVVSFGGFYFMFVYAGGNGEHGNVIQTHAADDLAGLTQAVPNSSEKIEELLAPAFISFMINLSTPQSILNHHIVYYPFMLFNVLGIFPSILLIMLSLAKCRVAGYSAVQRFGLILGIIFLAVSLCMLLVGLWFHG